MKYSPRGSACINTIICLMRQELTGYRQQCDVTWAHQWKLITHLKGGIGWAKPFWNVTILGKLCLRGTLWLEKKKQSRIQDSIREVSTVPMI